MGIRPGMQELFTVPIVVARHVIHAVLSSFGKQVFLSINRWGTIVQCVAVNADGNSNGGLKA